MRMKAGLGALTIGLGLISGCAGAPRYSGESSYQVSCANCHGAYGTSNASAVSASAPDLRYLAARNGGVFPRESVERLIDGRDRRASHGGDMPIWGEVFNELEGGGEGSPGRVYGRVQALVDYLERIQVSQPSP
jgi:hypothetical protein